MRECLCCILGLLVTTLGRQHPRTSLGVRQQETIGTRIAELQLNLSYVMKRRSKILYRFILSIKNGLAIYNLLEDILIVFDIKRSQPE